MDESRRSELLKEAFKYQGALTSYAHGMLRDWALSKDAVQNTFVLLVGTGYCDRALYPWLDRDGTSAVSKAAGCIRAACR